MQPLKHGSLLFLALAFLSGCRTSQPPKLSVICIGDGYGGANCADSAGNKVYKKPSELVNFWMTTENDEQNFAQWCYGSSTPEPIHASMNAIKEKVR